MSNKIPVRCPSCKTQFQVSEKFAGQKGPCPKCKKTIVIPKLEEQVTIHAPEEFVSGGKTVAGQVVSKPNLKPIEWEEVRFSWTWAIGIFGSALAVCLGSWLLKGMLQEMAWLRGVGLLLVTPALVLGEYTALRESELEPHKGQALLLRAAICSLVYLVLWGIYYLLVGFLPAELTAMGLFWLLAAPAFFVLGALAALACLEMEFSTGLIHYGLYVGASLLLGSLASLEMPWQMIKSFF